MKTGQMLAVVAMLLLFSGFASAQGVPLGNGIYACDGAAHAGPCQPDIDNDAPVPSVHWQDRWGAIAADDGPNAVFGIVTNMASKRAAQKAAIAECKNRGGGDCEVSLAYYNQCAAVAAGAAGTFSSSAATIEEAAQRATNRCEDANGRGACWVYYSGCSLPVRVQ